MELTRMTAAALSAALAANELSATEVTQAHLDRIAAVDDRVHAFLHVDADSALAAGARHRREARITANPSSPLAGVPVAVKDVFTTRGMPTTCGSRDPRRLAPAVRRHHRRAARARPARSSSARPTWTSSRWARPRRTPRSGRAATRGTWARSRAARPAGRPRRSPPTRRRWPSAPTPAARSASPPRSAARSARSRPTAARPATALVAFASSAWTRRDRCARTVLDAALLHEVIAGHDPLDSTSIDAPVPPGGRRRPATADVSGVRIGVVTELSGEGYEPGVMARFGEAVELLSVARRQGGRGVLPALQVRAAGLLPDRAERGLVQPGPVRRRAVRPAGRRRRRPGTPRRSWR